MARRIAISVLGLVLGVACGDPTPKLSLGSGCSYNSDCAVGLQCKLGRCQQPCQRMRDCEAGQRCVQVDGVGVCVASAGLSCAAGCKAPFVCGPDGNCRNACGAGIPCLSGHVCVEARPGAGVCADPEEPLAGHDAGVDAPSAPDAGPPLPPSPPDAPAMVPDAAAPACGQPGGGCCQGTTCSANLSCTKGGKRCTCVKACSGTTVLRNDGTIVAPGNVVLKGEDGQPFRADGALDLAAGWSSNAAVQGGCVIRADGTAWCWGTNRYGRLGAGVADEASAFPRQVITTTGTPLTGLRKISNGFSLDTTCATDQNGQVWCWGWGYNYQLGTGSRADSRVATPALVAAGAAPLTGAVDVSVGFQHVCVLKQDTSIWCWGQGVGEFPRSIASSGAAGVACGPDFCCFPTPGPGNVWCMGGRANDGQGLYLLGTEGVGAAGAVFGVMQIAEGRGPLIQALKSDLTVIEWDNTFKVTPAIVDGFNIAAPHLIGTGCFVTSEGAVLPANAVPPCD